MWSCGFRGVLTPKSVFCIELSLVYVECCQSLMLVNNLELYDTLQTTLMTKTTDNKKRMGK